MTQLPPTCRAIHLVERPVGEPRRADFRTVETALPEPGPGEILVRNTWMSIDPSTRIRMDEVGSGYMPSFEIDRPIEGWAVGEVVRSHDPALPVGGHVLHPFGWREFSVMAAEAPGRMGAVPIEVRDDAPAHLYLGALGWVGLTAYVGLFDVAELRDGDVVFVSGGAGAVGGLAIQIAKLRGHYVVGSAGSAAKVAYIRDELGADAAFCYQDGDLPAQLRDAAPDGIDVYFDNVAGDHLEAALDALRPRGRVALCGAISAYNEVEAPPGPRNLFEAVAKGLTLRGFLARMYPERLDEFRREMRGWLAAGEVVYPETVFEGLEQAPAALTAMMRGENVGKTLVKLD
jgi:NADPH-dependent curcumin reductase CurA